MLWEVLVNKIWRYVIREMLAWCMYNVLWKMSCMYNNNWLISSQMLDPIDMYTNPIPIHYLAQIQQLTQKTHSRNKKAMLVHTVLWHPHTQRPSLTCIQVSLCVPFSKSLHTLTPLVCDMLYNFAICPGGTNSSLRLDRNRIGTWCTYLIVLYDLHVWCTR